MPVLKLQVMPFNGRATVYDKLWRIRNRSWPFIKHCPSFAFRNWRQPRRISPNFRGSHYLVTSFQLALQLISGTPQWPPSFLFSGKDGRNHAVASNFNEGMPDSVSSDYRVSGYNTARYSSPASMAETARVFKHLHCSRLRQIWTFEAIVYCSCRQPWKLTESDQVLKKHAEIFTWLWNFGFFLSKIHPVMPLHFRKNSYFLPPSIKICLLCIQ